MVSAITPSATPITETQEISERKPSDDFDNKNLRAKVNTIAWEGFIQGPLALEQHGGVSQHQGHEVASMETR